MRTAGRPDGRRVGACSATPVTQPHRPSLPPLWWAWRLRAGDGEGGCVGDDGGGGDGGGGVGNDGDGIGNRLYLWDIVAIVAVYCALRAQQLKFNTVFHHSCEHISCRLLSKLNAEDTLQLK